MSMRDVLLPVAKLRGKVRLVDGRVATLIAVKRSSKARVHFDPDPLDQRAKVCQIEQQRIRRAKRRDG